MQDFLGGYKAGSPRSALLLSRLRLHDLRSKLFLVILAGQDGDGAGFRHLPGCRGDNPCATGLALCPACSIIRCIVPSCRRLLLFLLLLDTAERFTACKDTAVWSYEQWDSALRH